MSVDWQYGISVKLKKDGKWYYRRVHRLVAEAFIPNPENLPQVNHKNGDKTDCSVFNLEWCTNKDNTQHGYDNELYHSKHRCIIIEVHDKKGNINQSEKQQNNYILIEKH
jgi:hypothetical protein